MRITYQLNNESQIMYKPWTGFVDSRILIVWG